MTKLTTYLPLLFVSILLLFQANHTSWSNSLKIDVLVFYERSNYFINNHNFTNIDNEYQPGALLLFSILSPVLLISNSVGFFTGIFIFTNFLLIFLIAFLLQRLTNYKSVLILSLILLFMGPIIFYRFELFVVAIILLSLYFLKKQNFQLSAVSLAFATLTKIFPIILLPYFLLKINKNFKRSQAINFFLTYLISLIIFLILFCFIFKTSINDLVNPINYHASKSVSVESTWGSLITLIYSVTTDTFPPSEGAFRMWAIDRNYLFFPINFYNFIWIIPVFFLYFSVFNNNESFKEIDGKFLVIILFSFFLFSKVQAPQYLLWSSLLIPLISFEKIFLKRKLLKNTFFLILFTLFLTQFIYPLSYDKLLFFYSKGSYLEIFWLNLIRNILFIIILLFLILDYKNYAKQ